MLMKASKQVFSIRDLENLTGIKAHTIRTWEKRYNILTPDRNQNNVRSYSITNLRELMNIKLLNNHGYKISKISELGPGGIPKLLAEITNSKSIRNHSLNAFLLSMMDFDQPLFMKTYDALAATKTFREIYLDVFLPLLSEIGMLWQTGTITAVHEHFISEMIRQKTAAESERLMAQEPENTDHTVVLFLPTGEIHDTALQYLNFETLSRSYRTLYLGTNVTMDELSDLKQMHDNLIFVTYLTVTPGANELPDYLTRFSSKLLTETDSELWIAGQMARHFKPSPRYPNVTTIASLSDFGDKLERLTQRVSA